VGNIEFAWDRGKARSNLAKHGVSFEEAQTAFASVVTSNPANGGHPKTGQ
jgi:uncharacterized DUF497 family protein